MQTHKSNKKIEKFFKEHLPKHYIRLACKELNWEYNTSSKSIISKVKQGTSTNHEIIRVLIEIAKNERKQKELLEQSIN